MKFKNKNVMPVRQPGTPSMHDGKADANMPANNQGTFPVALGTTHNSKFTKGNSMSKALSGAVQQAGPKANMPANNNTNNGPSLGTTHHSVGTVPKYLRGSAPR